MNMFMIICLLIYGGIMYIAWVQQYYKIIRLERYLKSEEINSRFYKELYATLYKEYIIIYKEYLTLFNMYKSVPPNKKASKILNTENNVVVVDFGAKE